MACTHGCLLLICVLVVIATNIPMRVSGGEGFNPSLVFCATLVDVAWGDNQYVLAGHYAMGAISSETEVTKFYTSPDGVHWTNTSSLINMGQVSSVTFGTAFAGVGLAWDYTTQSDYFIAQGIPQQAVGMAYDPLSKTFVIIDYFGELYFTSTGQNPVPANIKAAAPIQTAPGILYEPNSADFVTYGSVSSSLAAEGMIAFVNVSTKSVYPYTVPGGVSSGPVTAVAVSDSTGTIMVVATNNIFAFYFSEGTYSMLFNGSASSQQYVFFAGACGNGVCMVAALAQNSAYDPNVILISSMPPTNNWTAVATPTTQGIVGLKFSNNLFFAFAAENLSSSNVGLLYTSPNGKVWTAVNGPDSPTKCPPPATSGPHTMSSAAHQVFDL